LTKKADVQMDIECKEIPVMNYVNSRAGEMCGHFTGKLAVVRDMRRVFGIVGTLTFLDGKEDETIRLGNLCADMMADGTRLFCLFNDPEWSKTHE